MTSARSILTASSAALLLACSQAEAPGAAPADVTPAPVAGTSAPAGRVMARSPVAPLQGDWVGVDDPKAGLVITNTELGHRYEGVDDRSMIPLMPVTDCKSQSFAPDTTPIAAFITSGGDGERQCYTVLSVSEDVLELSVAGRGNTLRYRRPS